MIKHVIDVVLPWSALDVETCFISPQNPPKISKITLQCLYNDKTVVPKFIV
jgi:hypothetical protein